MAPKASKVQSFILHALVPIICSIVVGYIFYQDAIFDRHYGSFQFVWSAVVASIFYYLLVYLRMRDALLGLLVLFLLTLVTTESTRPAFILRDIFYVGGIGASIFIYFRYFSKGATTTNYAYSALLLAGIYGIVYGIAATVQLALIQAFTMESTGGTLHTIAMNTAGFGLWIGFAVGAGITIGDRLLSLRGQRVAHGTL